MLGGSSSVAFSSAASAPTSCSMVIVRAIPRDRGKPFAAHGFRSAFRDWASETTDFPDLVVEAALAHTVKDKTEAACRRGPLLEKRRESMAAWSEFCLVRPIHPSDRNCSFAREVGRSRE